MAEAICCGVGAGLAHAHERGVVHGDLNSDTVMIRHDGWVLVDRVGMRHCLHEVGIAPSSSESAHVAPEQRSGQVGDIHADMYALAALYCEMLTGGAKIPSEAPAHTRQALVQALNPDPSGRFDSMAEMLEALTGRAFEESVEAMPALADLVQVQGVNPVSDGAGLRDAASRLLAFLSEDQANAEEEVSQPTEEERASVQVSGEPVALRTADAPAVVDQPSERVSRTITFEQVQEGRARSRSLLRSAGEAFIARDWDAAIELGERLAAEGGLGASAASELLSEARAARSLSEIVQRARALVAEGNTAQARGMVEEVLATDPAHPEALALARDIASGQ
jgi:serine/threonine protein kinase